eukprot:7367259-Ditylum_brightwellii.AAC.1
MTLVQQDAPDLVRGYCASKNLSMDGSTSTKERKNTDNKNKHKNTINPSTYKYKIDHKDIGNFQQCTH